MPLTKYRSWNNAIYADLIAWRGWAKSPGCIPAGIANMETERKRCGWTDAADRAMMAPQSCPTCISDYRSHNNGRNEVNGMLSEYFIDDHNEIVDQVDLGGREEA